MSLDLSRMRARIEARKPKGETHHRGNAKRALPEPVIKRQEEAKALADAASVARQRRLTKALAEHPPLAKFVSVLARELPETCVLEPGLVDLDLEHVIRGLGVHELPHTVRFLALEETLGFIKLVHRRSTRSSDITPYNRLFSPTFVDSLAEARTALLLH